MQRISGLLLIASGFILGSYTFFPPSLDGELALREMTRISAAPDRSAQADFPEIRGGSLYAGQSLATAGPVTPRLETGAVNKPLTTWSAIVTTRPAQGRITSSKPGDTQTRIQLARDLQVELKRVGCYSGEITGAWTQSTRRAMRTFMDRVNASLPYHEPDYILLTLVQGHMAKACGVECPAGQTASGLGRCLPNTVVAAHAARDHRKAAEASAATNARVASAKSAPAYLHRAASAAGPAAPVLISGPKLVATRTGEKEIAAQNNRERLPWLNDDGTSRRRVNRPDGMMAVGAPRQYEATQPPASVTITPRPDRVRIVTLEDKRDSQTVRVAPVLDTPQQYAKPDEINEAPRPAQNAQGSAAKRKHSKSAKRGRSATGYAGDSRRHGLRRSSPAYIMQQAMGGIF